MRKIWDKFVAWLLGIDAKLRLNFAGGFILAAFFAVVLGMRFCIWPVAILAFGKEFFLQWTDSPAQAAHIRWGHYVAALVGGLLLQVFVLLNLWWM